MDTYIVYFDETGDDGVTTQSSQEFILTSVYMPADKWQENYDKMKLCRQKLRDEYGFRIKDEMHTKYLLTDKNPYREYKWDIEQKKDIIKEYTLAIAGLDIKIINVIIDKTKFSNQEYPVLENALKYNIQRIENDSNHEWNYIIITDKGRIAPMKRIAREIRAYNPIQSKITPGSINQPIKYLIEDILEKDSKESHFIQVCDFVSYFVHLYYGCRMKGRNLPNRVGNTIDSQFVGSVMATLKAKGTLNLKASNNDEFGLVIYPK